MRMWLRDELRKIEKYLVDFLKASIARAEQDISLLMPGYGKVITFSILRKPAFVQSDADE